ncbi:gp53 minor capsid family protein [Francisella marina]|uniref:Uncharacterized protein n=1 Tax=Francisella marina TaxID=2249302 RepID=A0ABX5ZHU6_9GAMM|nr:hypothetical protein [Francisella marina]QEO57569.1 hypothetical protein F0R74_06775 [Francisella marina]
MARFSTPLADFAGSKAGDYTVINYADPFGQTQFQDGLEIGKFAWLNAGIVSNMDGTAVTPADLAGAVIRQVNAVESGETYEHKYINTIDCMRSGVINVHVKTGDTPAQYGKVYVENAVAGEYGKATTDNTQVAIDAEFLKEVGTNLWAVRINKIQ